MVSIDMSAYMEKHAVSRSLARRPVRGLRGGPLTEPVDAPVQRYLFENLKKRPPDVGRLGRCSRGRLTAAGAHVDSKTLSLILQPSCAPAGPQRSKRRGRSREARAARAGAVIGE